jgi:crossover junction endodeoxyribonuclease RuvC
VAVLVLGVDPGLTRCGVGVVEGALGRPLVLRHVEVLTSASDQPLAQRLLRQRDSLRQLIQTHRPDVVAIERVFAQHNVRTVMGTAQSSAMAVLTAAEEGIPVGWHTPTEVKAAVTGTGIADKAVVAAMVVRLLGLTSAPRPVDATDALALAICHVWRGSAHQRIADAVAGAPASRIPRSVPRSSEPGSSSGRPGGPGANAISAARGGEALTSADAQALRAAALAEVRAGVRPSVRRSS